MHTARAPWTQQIAFEFLTAEMAVRQLSPSGATSGGLLIGVAEPQPGGPAEASLCWPGQVPGRWLWRCDGAIAHSTAFEQQSALWRFSAGDTVGFAITSTSVSFLRNGQRVHTVPRSARGDADFSSRGVASSPVLFAGLSCDAVLQLCEGTQYLHLCDELGAWRALGGAELASSSSTTGTGSQLASSAGRRASTSEERKRLFRRAVRAVIWLLSLIRQTFKGPPAWGRLLGPESGNSDAAGKDEAGQASDIWVETTFVGSVPCFSKGRMLIDEVGGEDLVKQLIASYCSTQGRIEDAAASETCDVQEVIVNELAPLSSDFFITARVSARIIGGSGEKFRQASLERDGDCWKVCELLGEGSGKRGFCHGLQRLPAGAEVVAQQVEDGWLQVAGPTTQSRPLWYPITEAAETHFVRKQDLTTQDRPIFSMAATRSVASTAPPQLDCEILPIGREPYTIEASIRVPKADSSREMCIVAWGDEHDHATHGLALYDMLTTASGSIKGTRKLCDGEWHHVACTFDGEHRRLWADHELVGQDTPEKLSRTSTFSKGTFRLGEQEGSKLPFLGEIKRLRIWKVALTPAAQKAYAAVVEVQVRQQIVEDAVTAVFRGVDHRGEGKLEAEDLAAAFGAPSTRFFQRLDTGSKGFVSCDDWVCFCRRLKEANGEQDLIRFLQACARNLGQSWRPLRVQDEWEHPQELVAELALVSASWGWRVEAKPVSLTDAMLERIEDEGLERFRRQVRAAHALLGQSADEAIVELADRVALQQGNHDDCWTKMLAATEWSQAQPKWMEQAVDHTKLEDLSTAAKLQEVLAWAFATGRPLNDALWLPAGVSLGAIVASNLQFEELRSSAERAGGTAEVCAELASELLAVASAQVSSAATDEVSEQQLGSPSSKQVGSPSAKSASSPGPLQSAVDTMFCEIVTHMLFFRFLVLMELNWSVHRDFLPLIDLAAPADSAYGRLLAQVKPRLLGHLKFAQFQHVLQSTKYEGSTPSIILNRKAALTLRERGRVDWEFRRSLTGQFMSEIRKQTGGPKLFRRPWQSRCMKVQFKGEGGEDAGGLYREALDAVAQELHSKVVPLFVPCPNAVAEIGDNRDAWVLNPRATTPECGRALEFVGQLLGMALRTGDLLPLTLAPFTWKGIVGDERKREDVRSIDVFAEKHLVILGSEERPDESALEVMGGLQFSYPDVTGEEIELIEGGRDISVSPENAPEFARLLLHNRLCFDRFQLQALRRGLATVVPIQLIRLWSWRDLQERVCGAPEVDLENLKRHATYKNCTSTNVHVGYMWESLESFTQKQRRSFLRFVWGRSSLPTVEKWERNFTVQLLTSTDDSRLPCSHTCFFTLDLPTFSSAEVCRAKLLYCVTNCLAIDADGAAARSLNWDEDDDD